MTAPDVSPRVVVLAGGVGGARMAMGFAQHLPAGSLSIVVNVGDDEWFHGLKVCPDLDTVLYTLAGAVDRQQGWGVAGDTSRALDVLQKLGAHDTWMRLGDADLGLHIHRTQQLRQGRRLTEVMADVALGYGVAASLLPVTDAECPTLVETADGCMRFQNWFVQERGAPRVRSLQFSGAAEATVTAEVREGMSHADVIVIAPSNPLLSIEPMLAVGGMAALLKQAKGARVAVSPLVGGRALKGPLVKLMEDMGLAANAATIAQRYSGLIDAFVLDQADTESTDAVARAAQMEVFAVPTLIAEPARARELADRLMLWAGARRRQSP